MTNRDYNQDCLDIIKKIRKLNGQLKECISETDLDNDNGILTIIAQRNNGILTIIAQRQELLELLFSDTNRHWLLENDNELENLKQEVDDITTLYERALGEIKNKLLKTKKSKKGIDAYKNIK